MKNILLFPLLSILLNFIYLNQIHGQVCATDYRPFFKTYPTVFNDVDISVSHISGDLTTLPVDRTACCVTIFEGAPLVGSNRQNSEFTFNFSIPVKDVVFLMINSESREQFIVRTDSEGEAELEVIGDCKDSYSVSGSKIQSLANRVATAVRVKTQSCFTKLNFQGYGNPAGTAIAIYNFAPPPKSAGIAKACIGEKIYLGAKGGTAYKWSGPEGFTSNEQNPVINNAQIANSGTYYVTVTAPCGDIVRTMDATVTELTDRPVVSTPSRTCQGGQLFLAAKGASAYRWSGPNGFNSTEQNAFIDNAQPINSGIYTAYMSVNCGLVERTVEAIVETPSVGGYVLPTTEEFCGKKEVTLSLTGHIGSILRWEYITNFYNNGQYIGGSTPYMREVPNSAGMNPLSTVPPNDFYAGDYFYYAVVKNGVCPETPSFLNKIKNDRGAIGGKVVKKGTMQTSQGLCKDESVDIELTGFRGRVINWQITRANSPVWQDIKNTENLTKLTIDQPNPTTYYRAIICNEFGLCLGVPGQNYTAYSQTFKVFKSSMCTNNDNSDLKKTTQPLQVKLYPTPVHDVLNIEIEAPSEESVSLNIIDITGKTIRSEKQIVPATLKLVQMDLFELKNGMYFLQIVNEKGIRLTHKFVKTN